MGGEQGSSDSALRVSWRWSWHSSPQGGPRDAGHGRDSGRLLPPSLHPSVSQSFNAYFSHEHSRLLLVWRQVVGARRLVSEVKTATER